MNGFIKGGETEAAVLSILLARSYVVALPIGVHRFDMLVEFDGAFKKVQIKTGRRPKCTPTALIFHSTVHSSSNGAHRRYSVKDVDLFLVYDPISGKVYKIPSEIVVTKLYAFQLRLEPTKNNRKKNIHLARDFEL